MRVLLVEDDTMIARAVEQALGDAGHAVDWVADGQTALGVVDPSAHDLMLLDLGLAGCGGVEVLRRLRARDTRLPVIIVTARDQVDDRVACLDLGADDFLVKPFDVKELLARMRAVSRRREGSGAPALHCGALTLDPATRMAHYHEASCRLTPREFALMEALVRRPGAILSKSDLEGRLYGWNQEVESNTVEVLVHGLRRKLGPGAIRTVRGVGYVVERSP